MSVAGGIRRSRHRTLIERATAYLGAQRSPSGTWNFYGTTGFEPMPDDLDDTACALAALKAAGDSTKPIERFFLPHRVSPREATKEPLKTS